MKPIGEMTNEEFMAYAMNSCMAGWVPLKTYLRLYSDETLGSIKTRIKRKHWLAQIHYSTPKGGSMWINLLAVKAWITESAIEDDGVRFASSEAPDTLGRID